jgi:hypothetical protein
VEKGEIEVSDNPQVLAVLIFNLAINTLLTYRSSWLV